MVMPASPINAPAKVTPTDIPSGILCRVTARTSIVVFFNEASTPSGFSLSRCRCGIRLSSARRKAIPPKKPPAAGSQATCPCSPAISMAGIKRDHTDAAIMTPDAKPRSIFSTPLCIPFLIKNTIADPRVVPAKGIIKPANNCIFCPYLPKLLL